MHLEVKIEMEVVVIMSLDTCICKGHDGSGAGDYDWFCASPLFRWAPGIPSSSHQQREVRATFASNLSP